MRRRNNEKVIGMQIPDKEVPGWIKVLYENGFTPEEVDDLMSDLNEEYFRHTKEGQMQTVLEEELKKMVEEGQTITADTLDYLIRGIKERFGED